MKVQQYGDILITYDPDVIERVDLRSTDVREVGKSHVAVASVKAVERINLANELNVVVLGNDVPDNTAAAAGERITTKQLKDQVFQRRVRFTVMRHDSLAWHGRSGGKSCAPAG